MKQVNANEMKIKSTLSICFAYAFWWDCEEEIFDYAFNASNEDLSEYFVWKIKSSHYSLGD